MNWKWFVLPLFLALLAGCQPTPPPATETPLPTATPPPTATPLPAAQPTYTPSPTPTPIPTATPLPWPTVTPPAEPLDRFAQGRRLGRGVNLGNALEAPTEGEWGMVLEEAFFSLIAGAGFDTVRVPIRWSAHALAEPPYTINEAFFQRVDWVVENALANDLNVVLNMHHYDEIFVEPSEHEERFIAMWQQITLRYRDRPASLYLEPLNEPHDRLTPSRWNEMLARTVTAIRALDKFHTIVIEGGEWGGIAGLIKLQVPEGESNYVCSFHYYEPYAFTHQGAEWSTDPLVVGVQWPGPPEVKLTPSAEALEVPWLRQWYDAYNTQPARNNPASQEAMAKDLDWAVRGSKKLDCVLWMGEFGAYSKADMASRVNWTAALRQEAEKRDIVWAYWEFGAGFGIYDRSAGRWNEGLLRALIPAE